MFNAKALTAVFTVAMVATTPAFLLPAMAQQAPASSTVSEPELDAFVVALKDVIAIEQEYETRLHDVDDEAEQQAIIDEAQIEMTQAVDEAPNIEVDRYVEILQLAQADPTLQAQLTAKLQD